jgi:1A family penicillin-binding protein
MRWLGRMVLFGFMVGIACSVILLISLLYLRSQPLPPFVIQETTTLYAENGELIDRIHQGQNRTFVPIEQLPVHLIQAFIAVEDRRFFDHFGFDPKRIVGAVLVNLKERSLSEGGSTITQQLARNLYLDHSKTWSRKLKEALYTIQLELHLTKTEILEHYLNQIYFGHSAYGVEAAANLFFNKKASELTLAESALLAGVPKGPRYFSPWLNWENAKSRQELILNLMEAQGFITTKQKEQALAEPLKLAKPEEQHVENELAPYFRDYVRHQAIEHYGIPAEQFDHGGLKIYTTLNADMQAAAVRLFEKYMPKDRPLQGALLAADPRTGYIKAMVGGRDYHESPYNRVLAERQPGSAIKPFLYYAALENGFTPATLIKSEPTTFTYDQGRATYTPRNFNDRYPNDEITLEQALIQSDNIYAVKTIMHLGPETLVETLKRFGFKREYKPLPSLALGAQNMTLLELVKGYSALANQGVQAEPQAIVRIEDAEGQVLFEAQPKLTPILNETETFILIHMMEHVFAEGGTGHRVASLLHRPAAGKTGSTNTDSWMVGFTPHLVAGVWVGYDRNQLINHNNDGRLAATIWAHFIEEALADEPPVLFPVPKGVVGAYIDPENGLLATEHCPVKRLTYFKQGTAPTEICTEHLPDSETPPKQMEVEEDPSIWKRFKRWFSSKQKAA